MDREIQEGDVFLCIKTLFMNSVPKDIEYIKDKVYISEVPKCITDESGIKIHHWTKEKVDTYFILIGNLNKEMEEDRVNHPNHYTWLKELCGIEVIDITRHMDFNLGNCIKYILRSGHKSEQGMSDIQKQVEDLKKARFYIDDEIKKLENKNQIKDGVSEN